MSLLGPSLDQMNDTSILHLLHVRIFRILRILYIFLVLHIDNVSFQVLIDLDFVLHGR